MLLWPLFLANSSHLTGVQKLADLTLQMSVNPAVDPAFFSLWLYFTPYSLLQFLKRVNSTLTAFAWAVLKYSMESGFLYKTKWG